MLSNPPKPILNILIVRIVKDPQKTQMFFANGLPEMIPIQIKWLSNSLHKHASKPVHFIHPALDIRFQLGHLLRIKIGAVKWGSAFYSLIIFRQLLA